MLDLTVSVLSKHHAIIYYHFHKLPVSWKKKKKQTVRQLPPVQKVST